MNNWNNNWIEMIIINGKLSKLQEGEKKDKEWKRSECTEGIKITSFLIVPSVKWYSSERERKVEWIDLEYGTLYVFLYSIRNIGNYSVLPWPLDLFWNISGSFQTRSRKFSLSLHTKVTSPSRRQRNGVRMTEAKKSYRVWNQTKNLCSSK